MALPFCGVDTYKSDVHCVFTVDLFINFENKLEQCLFLYLRFLQVLFFKVDATCLVSNRDM